MGRRKDDITIKPALNIVKPIIHAKVDAEYLSLIVHPLFLTKLDIISTLQIDIYKFIYLHFYQKSLLKNKNEGII